MKLARDVLALAGIDRAPNERDLGDVQGWLAAGDTADTIVDVIRSTMLNAKGVTPSSLHYFDPPLRRGRKARRRAAASEGVLPASAPVIAPPPVAVSPADQALLDRLRAPDAAFARDRHGCPAPPSLAECKYPDTAASAERWLDVWAAWDGRGRPHGLKPPGFNLRRLVRAEYDADMAGIEEELSALDAPDAP